MKANLIRFETLISNATSTPESEVYFTKILIVNKGRNDEFYIDPRTWIRVSFLSVITAVMTGTFVLIVGNSIRFINMGNRKPVVVLILTVEGFSAWEKT